MSLLCVSNVSFIAREKFETQKIIIIHLKVKLADFQVDVFIYFNGVFVKF